jgi:copper chaperone CopZ
VARALEELPGVVAVRVDETTKTARVTYEPGTISLDAMTQAMARVDIRLRIRHWLHRLLLRPWARRRGG